MCWSKALDIGGGGVVSLFGIQPGAQLLQHLPGFARFVAVDAVAHFGHQQYIAPSAVQQFDHRVGNRALFHACQQFAQNALLGDFRVLSSFTHFLQAEYAGGPFVQQRLDHTFQLGACLLEHARVFVGFGVDAVGPATHQPKQARIRNFAVIASHHADAVERVQHLVRGVGWASSETAGRTLPD